MLKPIVHAQDKEKGIKKNHFKKEGNKKRREQNKQNTINKIH